MFIAGQDFLHLWRLLLLCSMLLKLFIKTVNVKERCIHTVYQFACSFLLFNNLCFFLCIGACILCPYKLAFVEQASLCRIVDIKLLSNVKASHKHAVFVHVLFGNGIQLLCIVVLLEFKLVLVEVVLFKLQFVQGCIELQLFLVCDRHRVFIIQLLFFFCFLHLIELVQLEGVEVFMFSLELRFVRNDFRLLGSLGCQR